MKEGRGSRVTMAGFLLAADRGGVSLWGVQQSFVSQHRRSGPAVRGGGLWRWEGSALTEMTKVASIPSVFRLGKDTKFSGCLPSDVQ